MRPRAIEVKPLENYKLLVKFSNKEIKIFDVKPYLEYEPVSYTHLTLPTT